MNLKDKEIRIGLAKESFLFFIMIYFPYYLSHAFCQEQKNIVIDLENVDVDRLSVTAFREFAKTTLVGLFFVCWCIVFQKSHFILFISEDKESACEIMSPLIYELQSNDLLVADFGQLYFEERHKFEPSKKKTISNFETANGIKILARGYLSKVRGLKFKKHRPDLVLIDDLETGKSVENKDMRDKKEKFIKAELLSGVASYARVIMLGNMIHSDCIMARVQNWEGWKNYFIPIITDNRPTWSERYVMEDKDLEARNLELRQELQRPLEPQEHAISIESIKRDKGTLFFEQEYMLKPIDLINQLIKNDWYRQFDGDYKNKMYKLKAISIDPAVKEKEQNDYTAITVAGLDQNNNTIIFDHRNIKTSFNDILETIFALYQYHNCQIVLVEDVQSQSWIVQELQRKYGIQVQGIHLDSSKRARLVAVSTYFENGKVYFTPNTKEVWEQIVSFGTAEKDDLVDSTTQLLKFFYYSQFARVSQERPDGM